MNGSGDQLLARTCLAKDQRSGISGCHPFHLCECHCECRAVAYDFFKFVLRTILTNWRGCVDVLHDVLLGKFPQWTQAIYKCTSCAGNTAAGASAARLVV